MANNAIDILSACSGDETDSAEETFAFTRKRKANCFFIDLTDDDKQQSKKTKPSEKPEEAKAAVQEYPDEAAAADSEIEVVKVIPPDASTSHCASHAAKVKVPLPKLFSPPHVV